MVCSLSTGEPHIGPVPRKGACKRIEWRCTDRSPCRRVTIRIQGHIRRPISSCENCRIFACGRWRRECIRTGQIVGITRIHCALIYGIIAECQLLERHVGVCIKGENRARAARIYDTKTRDARDAAIVPIGHIGSKIARGCLR